MLKKRPHARLKIGDQLLGAKISATVQGYVIYKEYDQEDRRHYYWEEWEITGLDDYDSWIEYDHYTKKITLYEPVDVGMELDPLQLKAGQTFTTTLEGKEAQLNVKEVGTGTVVRKEGTLTYHIFLNEIVAYAELTSPLGTISVEKYNNTEFDVYRGRVLSKSQQKEVFGRVVEPGGILKALRSIGWNIVWLPLVVVLLFFDTVFPSYETTCTPRALVSPATGGGISTWSNTAIPSDAELVSQDDQQTCYRRRVYGGGSGGAGK